MEKSEKIEITVQPIKKIVVFQCTKFSTEEFFKRIELIAKSGRPVPLNWTEGIVFLYTLYQPDSDVIIEEVMKGILYWSQLYFHQCLNISPSKSLVHEKFQ